MFEIPSPQPTDTYADRFAFSTALYGSALTFYVSNPHPECPKDAGHGDHVATIRMSNEFLKILTTVLVTALKNLESTQGISIPVSPQLLNQFGIGMEDFTKMWEQIPKGGMQP